MKDPTQRFLMTLPKPIYNQILTQAEKLGVSVQDRVRHMLAKQILEIKENTPTTYEIEIENICYELGKKTYDKFAVERKRLYIKTDNDPGHMYVKVDHLEDDVFIPVIQKLFYPYFSNPTVSRYGMDEVEAEFDKFGICRAAQQVAELENKLLSVCHDEDIVYEMMPFKCSVRYRDGCWGGTFRLCINSERTPTLADIKRVTS